MKVTFRKQGGKMIEGDAVGRMGSQLLIQYRIENGEPRERWIKSDRWQDLVGDFDDLPRYHRTKCPEVLFDGPTPDDPRTEENEHCPECGKLRVPLTNWRERNAVADHVRQVFRAEHGECHDADDRDQWMNALKEVREALAPAHVYLGWEAHSNIVKK